MAGAAEEERRGATSRLTIVVADDSPMVLALMAEVLKHSADAVVTARDGEAAWQAIRKHRPRVAILDDRMPGRTGVEVAALVQGDPELAETRVVLVTGEASGEADAAAGVRRVLPKPFRPNELVEVVRDLAA
jgi:CheY-like chemotaxis protein